MFSTGFHVLLKITFGSQCLANQLAFVLMPFDILLAVALMFSSASGIMGLLIVSMTNIDGRRNKNENGV